MKLKGLTTTLIAALVALCLLTAPGCALLTNLSEGDLAAAAYRACDAVERLSQEPGLVDPEKLEDARSACRIARALAGLGAGPEIDS